jgi:putative ABC transport system permease protein
MTVLWKVAVLLLPRAEREFVLGDLLELHSLRAERLGRARATLYACRDLVGSAWSGWTGRRPRWRRPPSYSPAPSPIPDAAQDLVRAVRSVARDRSFSAVVVLTLALGIGAAASVFGMVNQLVLRPLPGTTDPRGADYLRLLSRDAPDPWNGQGLATLDFDALRRGADFATGVASYGYMDLQVSVGDERPRAVRTNSVYGDYFDVLGVRPAEGRLLTADDAGFGADPLVAVISADLRNELFGPGGTAVGQPLNVNGVSVRVLGVTPPGFQGPERRSEARMWVPYPALVPLLSFPEDRLLDRNSVMHNELVVRLRPEWTRDRAEARIEALLEGIGAAVPDQAEYLAGLQPRFFPGLTTPPGPRASIARSLTTLGVIVGMVVLLACGNVANLFLFRNVARRGSAAVRRALGASSGRIMRGELAHALILATLGSIGGLVVAWLISLLLRGERLIGMPGMEPLVLDARVLGFAAFMSVLTAILFGTVPALLAGRFDLRGALQSAGRGDTGRVARVRAGMASLQIGLSLALLIAGVMLVRTVANLYDLDLGLRIDRVAVIPVDFPNDFDENDERLAGRRLVRDLEALPGVERASVSMYDPLGGARFIGRIARDGGTDEERVAAELIPVSAGWFDVVGMNSEGGAPIRLTDEEWDDGAVVLSKAMALRLYGQTENVIGRTVHFRSVGDLEAARIVAITSDLRRPSDPDAPREAVFVPWEKSPSPSTTLVVRAATLDGATLTAIRTAVGIALPDAPVAEPVTAVSHLDAIHAEARVFGRLLALLSSFSALLAAVGLYGVMAFSVAGRRRELGVRMAIGAGPFRIVRLVLGNAGSIVVVGSLFGVAGGYALSRVLDTRLYGVEALDARSYATAVALLAITAIIACLLPTRRATRVDPISSLRSD